MKRNERTNLECDVVFASFKRGGDELREGIVVGSLNARWPGGVALVAEENVAVVSVDGAGELLGVHLRAGEAVGGVAGGGEGVGGH